MTTAARAPVATSRRTVATASSRWVTGTWIRSVPARLGKRGRAMTEGVEDGDAAPRQIRFAANEVESEAGAAAAGQTEDPDQPGARGQAGKAGRLARVVGAHPRQVDPILIRHQTLRSYDPPMAASMRAARSRSRMIERTQGSS